MICLPRSTPDMLSSMQHVFGPELICNHEHCERTWKQHQSEPSKCEGIQRSQRANAKEMARRERENADE